MLIKAAQTDLAVRTLHTLYGLDKAYALDQAPPEVLGKARASRHGHFLGFGSILRGCCCSRHDEAEEGMACPLHRPIGYRPEHSGRGHEPRGSHFVHDRANRATLRTRAGLRDLSDAWRAGRSARAVTPASRSDGGAGQRAGSPRQGGGADRRQHGGGGLLRLRVARRRNARAIRHRGPQARGGARDRAQIRRGPGRPGGQRGQSRSTCRTPSRTRPSRSGRKPARKSTTPSSACRCCAPATRSAC